MGEVKPHEIEFNVRYGRRYYERNTRMYRRAANYLRFFQASSALAGFTAYIQKDADLAGAAGLVVAIVLAVDLVFHPGEKAARSDAFRRKFAELFAQLHDGDAAGVQSQLVRLQAESCDVDTESLRAVAYNDALIEMGYDAEDIKAQKMAEGVLGKVYRALA